MGYMSRWDHSFDELLEKINEISKILDVLIDDDTEGYRDIMASKIIELEEMKISVLRFKRILKG